MYCVNENEENFVKKEFSFWFREIKTIKLVVMAKRRKNKNNY